MNVQELNYKLELINELNVEYAKLDNELREDSRALIYAKINVIEEELGNLA